MDVEKRYRLITRNLEEVVTKDDLKTLLHEKDHPHIYLGTAITGRPHLAYMMQMQKIKDFLRADCKVTILFADLHGYLDHMKSSWELLEKRTEYYRLLITTLLKTADVPLDKLNFVQGTDIQLEEDYILDMYKMSAMASVNDTTRAGSEVVKQVESPKISGLLYPILQALDEEYLDVDMQFGGVDQRKIFMFARENLPSIGYEKRVHLMNPMMRGLTKSGKMSSSKPKSKIDYFDTDEDIEKKVQDAYSKDGDVDNGLLDICKYILFPMWKKRDKTFTVERPDEYGGDVTFETYDELATAFENEELSSIDLKQNLAERIIEFIRPIREELSAHKELINEAYPEDEAE